MRSTIVFDMDNRQVGGPLTGYIVRGWAKRRLNDVERLTVNGLPAATGWLVLDLKKGRMVARLLAIRSARNEVFRFLFIAPPTVTKRLAVPFRRTTYSFRRLSKSEAGQISPRRLIIKRRQDVKLNDLVARMHVDSHAEGWFALLNGLAPGKRPNATDMVRLVVL